MKFRFHTLLVLVSFVFFACKKEKEEIPVKAFEMRFTDPSLNVPVMAGSMLMLNFELLDHGRLLQKDEFENRLFTVKFRLLEGPLHATDQRPHYLSPPDLEVTIPVVEGNVKYMVDVYEKGTVIVSVPLSFNITLPKEGWIPKDFLYCSDLCQAKDGKVYLRRGVELYQSDAELNNFQLKNVSFGYSTTLFGATGTKVYAFEPGGRLFFSTDEGSTFSQRLTGITGIQFATLLDDNRMIMASADSARITDDEGLTWKPFNIPGKITKIRQLADHSLITMAYTPSSGPVLYYSADATAKPKLLKFPQGMVDMETAGSTIYALTNGGLYRSVNKGASFEDLGFNSGSSNYWILSGGQHLLIKSDSGLKITKSLEDLSPLREVPYVNNIQFYKVLSGNRLFFLNPESYLRVLKY